MTATGRPDRWLTGVQTPEEGPSGGRIKFAFLPGKAELAVPQANRSEVSHAFAGGMVENNRICHFRGNPHDGAGAVLLEIDFINGPEVIACQRQPLQFFYLPSGPQGRHGPSEASAFAAKAELTEEPLALPHLEIHAEAFHHKGGKRLAIPDALLADPSLLGALAQGRSDHGHLFFIKPPRPARTIALGQAGKPVVFKTPDPILHGSRGITEHGCHLRTAQALGHKQNPMQAVVVATLVATADFIMDERGSWILRRRCVELSSRQHNGQIAMRNYL